jgi:S-formylglutathione hydrolase FrmB
MGPSRRQFLQSAVGVGALSAVGTSLATNAFAGPAGQLSVTAHKRVRPRLHEYSFSTPSLVAGDARARVLLPDDYDNEPGRRYPVVYLLHGASFEPGHRSWVDWTELQRAEAITADVPVIVVMPGGGLLGFYTDWFNQGRGGPPKWETFHIDELIPWVDNNFRTRAQRSGRAVAGVSMGGFGALSYAARHPDLFAAAAAFSGVVSLGTFIRSPVSVPVELFSRLAATEPFGPPLTRPIGAWAHDPVALAANLQDVDVSLFTGDGRPGPLDVGEYAPGAAKGPDPFGFAFEVLAHECSLDLHRKLASERIHHHFDDYGPGTHTSHYVDRNLAAALPRVMDIFDAAVTDPASVSYTSADSTYDIFGWHVDIDRAAAEFSLLDHADPQGFRLRGSGTATVLTPAFYRPGSTHQVRVAEGEFTASAADDAGRLAVSVDLGPANANAQFSPGVFTRQVSRTVTIN